MEKHEESPTNLKCSDTNVPQLADEVIGIVLQSSAVGMAVPGKDSLSNFQASTLNDPIRQLFASSMPNLSGPPVDKTHRQLNPHQYCLVLWASLYFALWSLISTQVCILYSLGWWQTALLAIMVLQAYTIYLCVATRHTRHFLLSFKRLVSVDQCQKQFQKVVSCPPIFTFTSGDLSSQDKLVGVPPLESYRSSYAPPVWSDQSSPLSSIRHYHQLVVLTFKQSFHLSTKKAEKDLMDQYNSFGETTTSIRKFLASNTSVEFNVPAVPQRLAFCSNPHSQRHLVKLYYVCMALGLSYPFCAITEKFTGRYCVHVIKKIGE